MKECRSLVRHADTICKTAPNISTRTWAWAAAGGGARLPAAGLMVAAFVGFFVGLTGFREGFREGLCEGLCEGLRDGFRKGLREGLRDGFREGL